MADYTVSFTQETTEYTVAFTQAARGPQGDTGPAGTPEWDGISGKPDFGTAALEDVEAFAAASHTHVSAEITDATHLATPNTVVKRNATGAAYFGDVAGDVGSFQSAQIAGNLTALGNGSIGGSFQAGFGGFQVTDTGVTSATNLSGTNTGDQTSIVGIGGTMAQFDTACADGVFVFQSSALGTPSSGTLTNCAGLPISTGVSGLASGIATFLTTPTSANLASAITDENGSGKLIFSAGTLAIASGKTATINNTVTWNGTDGTTMTLPSTSATLARTDTGQTFAGNNTYSGQIQFTGQAATDDNSAMTRGLQPTETIWNMFACHELPVMTYANSGTGSAAAMDVSGWKCVGGTAAASYGQCRFSGLITGTSLNSAYPITFTQVGNYWIFDTSSTSLQAIRFVVGGPTTPTFADQNPLTARGFGWEIYYDTAAVSHKIRAFAHDGTTFTYGTGSNISATSTTLHHIIVKHLGNGTINVYASSVNNGGNGPDRPSTTPIATCTGAPTSGNFSGPNIYMAAVAHSTSPGTTAGAQCVTTASRVKVN